jgi:DNA polymerase-1
MQTTGGIPANAVFGFIQTTMREIKRVQPTHLAVAMDVPLSENRRTKVYADYKANRGECPPELNPQFDLLREALSALNIPWFQVPGYEADDLVGSLATQAEAAGMDAYILTGDRDVLQLLSARTAIRFTKKLHTPDVYDIPRFVTEFGLHPHQLTDLKGLAGDPSDNLPGIKGIGPKTAQTLLQQYGDLETVLENANEQKGKLRERLLAGADIARLCKMLATIDRAVPDLPELSALQLKLDREGGAGQLKAWGMRGLVPSLA